MEADFFCTFYFFILQLWTERNKLKIISRELFSSGLYKIQTDTQGVFFIRPHYLKSISPDIFLSRDEYSEEESEDFIDAGLVTATECKAVEYLARSEQCRSALYTKLIQKGYEKVNINAALDYLESVNYLSDERFARSWLSNRKINHTEGKTRLQAELASRGISKEIIDSALNEFFSENDEREIARKAYEKLRRKGKTGDKLISAMLRLGFSYKMINEIITS